jgi:hypothetical protein
MKVVRLGTSPSTGISDQAFEAVMKTFRVRRLLQASTTILAAILPLAGTVPATAQTNSWTNSVSGKWEDPRWSLGILPGPSQDILFTNAGWKAVEINPSTATSFHQTLTVRSVTILSPVDSFNTLLLNFSGTQTPLIIATTTNTGRLVIGSGAAMLVLSAGLTVSNSLAPDGSELGAFDVSGTFTEDVMSKVTTAFMDVHGVYNLTNSALFAGLERVASGGVFNQQGGTNNGGLSILLGGEYDLFSGSVTGAVSLGGGQFKQMGGVVTANIGFAGGDYDLSDGMLFSGNFAVSSVFNSFLTASFNQSGGTNVAGSIVVGNLGFATYGLSGGWLSASNLYVVPSSVVDDRIGSGFTQMGGYHTNGAISIQGAFGYGNQPNYSIYYLGGGVLDTPSINLGIAEFHQAGGSNRVGSITMFDNDRYLLSGGVLVVSNLHQDGGALVDWIQQSGGTNIVSGTLSLNNSTYYFSGGKLQANLMQLTNGTILFHSGGFVSGNSRITLAHGAWIEQTNGAQLGQLQLAGPTNSLGMPSGDCVLRFADSSAVAWTAGVKLAISGWAGSLYGGGAQQIFFGNSGAGLTGSQLSELEFHNPAGLTAGDYPARLLSDGEVVPNTGAPLPLKMGVAIKPNRTIQLSLGGNIGSNYGIQVSSNLLTWTLLTNLTDTNGTISVLDTTGNRPVRFYRAIWLP